MRRTSAAVLLCLLSFLGCMAQSLAEDTAPSRLGLAGLTVQLPKEYMALPSFEQPVVAAESGDGTIRFFANDPKNGAYAEWFLNEYPGYMMLDEGVDRHTTALTYKVFALRHQVVSTEEMQVAIAPLPVEAKLPGMSLVAVIRWRNGFHQKILNGLLDTLRIEESDEPLPQDDPAALAKLIGKLEQRRTVRPKIPDTLSTCKTCGGTGTVASKNFCGVKVCTGGKWKSTRCDGTTWDSGDSLNPKSKPVNKLDWPSKILAAEWCATCDGIGKNPYRKAWILCGKCGNLDEADPKCPRCKGTCADLRKGEAEEKSSPVSVPVDQPLLDLLKQRLPAKDAPKS